MKQIENRCSLLVSSCDKYSDLWVPFFQCLDLYWSQRQLNTFILCESKRSDIDGIKFINSGKKAANWSSNLKYALEKIETKYVCLMLEDFFLRSLVDHSKFMYCLNFADINNADMIRLLKKPTLYSKQKISDKLISKLNIHAPYRVSCQASLWNRETLISLLEPGETAWEFEINGSKRSKNRNLQFYATKKSVLTYFHHVVERGIWFPWDAWYFSKKQISCDFSSRKIMTWPYGIFWLIRKLILNFKRRLKIIIVGLLNEN